MMKEDSGNPIPPSDGVISDNPTSNDVGNGSVIMDETDSFQAQSQLPQMLEMREQGEDTQHLVINLDLAAIKKEILRKCNECQQRGLTQSYKWLAEVLYVLRNVNKGHKAFAKHSAEEVIDATTSFEYSRWITFSATQMQSL